MVRAKLDESDDFLWFVCWLRDQENVKDVRTSKVFLTSNPPQQLIHFTLDGVGHGLFVAVEGHRIVRPVPVAEGNAENDEQQREGDR